MSFSGEVKDELVQVVPQARHCQIAELAAFVLLLSVNTYEVGSPLIFHFDSDRIKRKLFTLLELAFNINEGFGLRTGKGSKHAYRVTVTDPSISDEIRKSTGHRMVLAMNCCKRAFMRGAFLAGGSISTPEKYYHFEIVTSRENSARTVDSVMKYFGLGPKIVLRKRDYVVYLKEGEQLVDVLGVMGAGLSVLNLENIRVTNDMRGRVNRRVNCETANLAKAARSAVKQREDIEFIRDNGGFGNLSENLREIAEIRLAYPEVSMTEVGEHLDPPIGKSGVNHRLRKLSEIAKKLRDQAGKN